MNRSLPLLGCAAGIALLAGLAGCSASPAPSSPGPSSPGPSSPAASAGSSSSAAASVPAASGTSLDKLCSLLTLEAVNAVVGVVFATADDSVDAMTGDHLCTYRASDGAGIAVLDLITPGRTTYEQLAARGGSPFVVDQVGDRASYDGDELDFQTGDHLFSVTSTGTSELGLGDLAAIGSATVAYLR